VFRDFAAGPNTGKKICDQSIYQRFGVEPAYRAVPRPGRVFYVEGDSSEDGDGASNHLQHLVFAAHINIYPFQLHTHRSYLRDRIGPRCDPATAKLTPSATKALGMPNPIPLAPP